MILYLAGLRASTPRLREAAAIDGAKRRQTFLRVIVPAMKPINVTIIVITVMESLRAFDMVYVLSGTTAATGLELLSLLITTTPRRVAPPRGTARRWPPCSGGSLAAIVTSSCQNFRKERQA